MSWLLRENEGEMGHSYLIKVCSLQNQSMSYWMVFHFEFTEWICCWNWLMYIYFSTLKMAAWGSGPPSGSAEHTTEVLTRGHFEQQKVQRCAHCTCAVHMQMHFTTLCFWWLCSRCLLNPCQSDIWWLTTARRNFYHAVLIRIYHDCAIMEAWLPFMTCRIWRRIWTIRTLLSGCMTFSVHDNNM